MADKLGSRQLLDDRARKVLEMAKATSQSDELRFTESRFLVLKAEHRLRLARLNHRRLCERLGLDPESGLPCRAPSPSPKKRGRRPAASGAARRGT